MEEVVIETEEIQLDQFLKWAGILSSGGEIKSLLEDRRIKKNGETESAKRRKLHAGDIIEIEGIGAWKVVRKEC